MAVGVPAADIARAQTQPQRARQLGGTGDFALQRFRIRLGQLSVADFAGGERAVCAARHAEGNANVQVEGVRGRVRQPALHLDDFAQQRRLFGAHEELARQPRFGLLAGKTALHGLIHQPRGANAGQGAPRGHAVERVRQKTENRRLCRALEHALFFQPAAHGVCGHSDFPRAVQLRALNPCVARVRVRVGNLYVARVRQNRHVAQKQAHDLAELRIQPFDVGGQTDGIHR